MWIPIAFIAIVIWYICYLVNTAKSSRFDADMKRKQEAKADFQVRMTDSTTENEQRRRLQFDQQLRQSLVKEFMQGGDEWITYTGYGPTAIEKAVGVVMAQRGYLPRSFTDGWLQLQCPIPDKELYSSSLSPAQCIIMNEKFLLKMEEELNSIGRNVKVLYQANDCSWHPLLEDVAKFGYSRTHFFTHFQFVSSGM